MEKKVVLKVNGQAIHFNVTAEAQERLINETMPNNRVNPMHNFLMRTVEEDSKAILKPLLAVPSTVVILAEKVTSEFVPQLEITVGE
ncbi:putative phage tail assembly chaperone [Desulfosediminicola sp.]|uniref:putative phage tail assembly chaperone n=1 Tax=Desulfosediminicola sp. TaxID=2886825 RepID=UPI003AF31190